VRGTYALIAYGMLLAAWLALALLGRIGVRSMPLVVPTALAAEGSTFAVEIRGRPAAARVVKTPFYVRK